MVGEGVGAPPWWEREEGGGATPQGAGCSHHAPGYDPWRRHGGRKEGCHAMVVEGAGAPRCGRGRRGAALVGEGC